MYAAEIANDSVKIKPTRTKANLLEKITVSGAALGFATAMFIISSLLLTPNFETWMHNFDVPSSIQQVVVLTLLFGLPLLTAIYGVKLVGKSVFPDLS